MLLTELVCALCCGSACGRRHHPVLQAAHLKFPVCGALVLTDEKARCGAGMPNLPDELVVAGTQIHYGHLCALQTHASGLAAAKGKVSPMSRWSQAGGRGWGVRAAAVTLHRE